MKLLHIADLHLGKRVCEYPMMEDQRHILREIADVVRDQGVQALLIAGDVYDRPVPPQEATELLSDFLCEIAALNVPVFMIAGNHDSAARLSFCAGLLQKQGVYVTGVNEGEVLSVLLPDTDPAVAVHMISYARPAALRPFLGETVASAEDAMRAQLARIDRNAARKNILLAHAFVQGGEASDSEESIVGTVENVSTSVFEGFDYVALGHLHRPQTVGEGIRYAGSPLAYSFSEIGAAKSVTLVDITDEVRITPISLHPLHEMREVRGTLAQLLDMPYSEDYVRAVVTDEDVAPDARITLRSVFPNLMRFAVENSKTVFEQDVSDAQNVSNRAPLELFEEFYTQQNGTPPDEKRMAIMRELLGGEVSV